MDTAETDLLEVRDLAVTYRTGGQRVRAVRGVSFSLAPGQTLGMAGESGSGKTTVALSLLRLLPPAAEVTGKVLFRGEDVLGLGWQRLRELCRSTRLPVYALGGLGEQDLGRAREAGAHGVAAIRGLWPGALPRA